MFGKNTNTIPQRKPFQFTVDQIKEDVEAVCLDEEQRHKLYFCTDKKPPHEHQFSKLEDFLKGTDNLEDAKQNLENLVNDIEDLVTQINRKLENIQNRVGQCNLDS